MEVHHLVIKGTKYDISNIHELLSEISWCGSHTKKQVMTQYAILGNFSPFSNFHVSNFIVDDCEFVNLEKYIQCTKAN